MLQIIHPDGAKPAFFMVHGLHGVMSLGARMARVLDLDRPIFAVHARGIDGGAPPHERMEDMLDDYLAQIRAARPRGPYIVGGLCGGGLIAMELARALAAQGERVGSTILLDPPLVPYYRAHENRTLNPKADPIAYRNLRINVEQTFRKFAHYFHGLPYDVNDPARFERTIETGIALLVMLGRYVPPRFDGRTEFIICAARAFGHFHPESHWVSIVPRPGRVHVIPGNHDELYLNHLDEVLRLMQFALDSAFET